MTDLRIPCHACGFDNPIGTRFCLNSNCQALLRLRPTTTTQCLSFSSARADTNDVGALYHEALIVVQLLIQSANRLRAFVDVAAEKSNQELIR